MTLKESKRRHVGEFGGRKREGKDNVIIILKCNKSIFLVHLVVLNDLYQIK